MRQTSSPDIERLKRQASEEVERLRPDLIRMSRSIHAHPEIAFEEHRSMAVLADRVEGAGFEVTRGIAGLPTAFKASCSKVGGGPHIAFLAEYDALPELGHACGHNIIGVSSTGAALAMQRVLDSLPGTITLLGTPAEEAGGGKILLLNGGAFEDIDMAMLVHPSTRTMTRRRSLAAQHIGFEFVGREAHASSSPEHGINALDACIQTFNNINALRQHIPDKIRIHGIITHGGDVVNIVPAFAAANFMVRAPDAESLRKLVKRVEQCAQAAAKAMGAKLAVKPGAAYAEMIVNETMASCYAANIEALGETVIEPDPDASLASSDMGNVSQVIPSIQPHIKIAPEGIAGHTKEFCEAAASEQGQEGLIRVSKALAMTAIDLLASPDLVLAVRQEFDAATRL